jgi:hypothetical protein
MIGRLWHGWMKEDNAGAYQDPLTRQVRPGIAERSEHAEVVSAPR